MMTLWQDVRYALRILARGPGFTLVVVVILALGIGANTAVFSVVNAVLLRPLPYADGRRLVMLEERPQLIDKSTIHQRFFQWREQNQVFEHLAAFSGRRPYVTDISRPRYIGAAAVSSDLFSLLGVSPQLGRGFLPEEEQAGHDQVVILSHTFWRDDLGGNPDVMGKAIGIDGRSCTVIGVMPPGFTFPVGSARAFWVPLVYEPNPRWGGIVFGVARLKPGVTWEQAQAAMTVIADRLKQAYPQEAGPVTVRRLLDFRLGANRQLLWLLLGAAGFVLLIACTNVASLLLARATVRQREMAMRVALGASRARLLRQVLTESVLLSLAGGVLGILVTFWTIQGVVRLCPADIPRLRETSVDGAVLVFTLSVSVLTGLLFGMIPGCRASDVHVSRVLKEGQTRSSTGRGWRCLHGGLVVAQTGLSLILLIGAALLIRTWIALQRTDLGFRPDHVLSVDISLRESRYPVYNRCESFFEPLLQRVRALPGVQSAAVIPFLDFGFDAMKERFSIIGRPPLDSEQMPLLKVRDVMPGLFETLGMRILKGRTVTEQDMEGTTRNVVIDETLARKHFADVDPIEQKIRTKDTDYTIAGEDVDYTVVGVVSTLKDFDHLDPPLGTLYHPHDKYWRDMILLVRAEGDPLRLVGAIRTRMAELEKDDVITEVQTLEAHLADLLAPRRFSVVLLGLFAGIALTLAAAGIYGLLQYSTAQQTHDIGIRMALGARRADVLKAVLGHGLRLTFVGVVIGLGGAYALTRLLSSLLYGVPPTDLPTFVGVSLVLVAIALLASYLPARRAARIDPMVALRHE
jgi:putative ABC transport system permease protein